MATIRDNKLGNIVYHAITSSLYFSPILLHNRNCRKRQLLPLYQQIEEKREKSEIPDRKTVIYMVLKETVFSGGLSDRLRAIISIYDECKRQNIPFKINFTTPPIADYLEPNLYDWRVTDKELSYKSQETYPCTLLTYHNINNRWAIFAQRQILRQYLKKERKQIHIYSNMATADKRYSELFHELFKPSQPLQEQIDFHLNKIGGKRTYIAMVYRFRQLLGDFKEGGETLPAESREEYIERCIRCIEQMHDKHPTKRILVTSDSTTFLNRLQKLDYVYTIPGEVVHISHVFNASKATYLKSFVDYYMLSYASTVYLVRDRKMYHSGFAHRAALLHNAEYKEVKL